MKISGIIITLLLLLTLVGCASTGTPSKPTVGTNQCTDIATTSPKAQGEVTDRGGATITRRGFYYGTAPLYGLEFDGIDDLVTLPAGSQPTGAFTLAIWCKPTDWEHTTYPTLFGGKGIRAYKDGLSGITITGATDKLYFDVADERNQARRTIAPLITKIAPAGEWSFIVLTNSGVAEAGGLKLYRNSALLVGNTIGAQTVRWLDNYIELGGCAAWPKDDFKGIISEVHIYDRALNTTEIKTLYNGQDVTGDLRGYWKLDEGSGNTTYDSSGNGNNGSLVNGPVWFIGGDTVDETGNFGIGTYSLNITGLELDTWYTIMAFAENEAGIGYGKVVSYKTLE
jgi:hypothetical protein